MKGFPQLMLLRDATIGAYCVSTDATNLFRVLKMTQTKGRSLLVEKEIDLQNCLDTQVLIIEFPSLSVCYHEAAHLVVGLDLGSNVYQSGGILFFPFHSDAGEFGSWIKPDAKAAIRLSLVGILAQIVLSPESIEEDLLEAMKTSVIFGDDHPIPATVSDNQKTILAGAGKDIENAKQAGIEIVGNSREELVKLLRSIEACVRGELQSGNLLLRIKKVGDDIPFWFQHEGLKLWEEAIALTSHVSYPANRAKLILS